MHMMYNMVYSLKFSVILYIIVRLYWHNKIILLIKKSVLNSIEVHMYLKKLSLQINLILYFLLRYMFYASPQYVIANFISYYKK